MKYKVKTEVLPNGIIEQDVILLRDKIAQTISRTVIDTQEQQTRDALIKLGWTPPEK